MLLIHKMGKINIGNFTNVFYTLALIHTIHNYCCLFAKEKNILLPTREKYYKKLKKLGSLYVRTWFIGTEMLGLRGSNPRSITFFILKNLTRYFPKKATPGHAFATFCFPKEDTRRPSMTI